MKKSVILGLLGLTATVASSFGQGFIKLDNYTTYGPLVTYGAGVPANGTSGAAGGVGTGLLAGWTAGLYVAPGNITGSLVGGNVAGNGLPTDQNAAFVLISGTGATTQFASALAAGAAGSFFEANLAQVSAAAGATVTVEVIAYSTSIGNYANSNLGRGHSIAFTMTALAGNAPTPNVVGNSGLATFNVTPVPEPSVFALSGLGAAALMIFRRKK